MPHAETIIISLGGSLVVPEEIDLDFLKKFRELVLRHSKNKKFVLMVGGGKTARNYQKAAGEFSASNFDSDMIGIMATRLNAELVRAIFSKEAYKKIIYNPTEKIKFSEKILVAAGWEPGCATDFDAVLIAKNFGAKTVINLSNIDYVYDKNPKEFPDAAPIEKISWKDYRKMFSGTWTPGFNSPFDPVAAKEAQKLKLKVIIANGKNLENLERVLRVEGFVGTEIF